MIKLLSDLSGLLNQDNKHLIESFQHSVDLFGHFFAHLTGLGRIQGEAEFDLVKGSSAIKYQVILTHLEDGMLPKIHLHLKNIRGPIGVLKAEGELSAWKMLGSNLLVPAGLEPCDLFITDPADREGLIHYKQLKPLVEHWLALGRAYIDVHDQRNHLMLRGEVSGCCRGKWPEMDSFVLEQ